MPPDSLTEPSFVYSVKGVSSHKTRLYSRQQWTSSELSLYFSEIKTSKFLGFKGNSFVGGRSRYHFARGPSCLLPEITLRAWTPIPDP